MQWRWSTAIPTCNDSGDEPQPSQLHSWLVWRMQFTEETGSWRFWNRFLPYIYGDPQEWKRQNIVEAFAKIKRIEIDFSIFIHGRSYRDQSSRRVLLHKRQ